MLLRVQATVCAKFGLKCIVYMGKKVGLLQPRQTAYCSYRQSSQIAGTSCCSAHTAHTAKSRCCKPAAQPRRVLHASHALAHSLPISAEHHKFKHHYWLLQQDMERQQLNVFRMRLLGAEVREVAAGTATLKDATSEAIRDWVTNVETTHYILGSAAGPHPYPMMARSSL